MNDPKGNDVEEIELDEMEEKALEIAWKKLDTKNKRVKEED